MNLVHEGVLPPNEPDDRDERREEREMAQERETLADILAEWRDCIEAANPTVWNDARIAGLVKTTKAQQLAYLDRIEAAWKREREHLLNEIANAAAGI